MNGQSGWLKRLDRAEASITTLERQRRYAPLQDEVERIARKYGQTPDEVIAGAEACAQRILAKHWAGMTADQIAAETAGDDPRYADVRAWVIALLEARR